MDPRALALPVPLRDCASLLAAMTSREVIAGRDPRPERAVEGARRFLREEPGALKPEPPPPVRWRMPGG